MRNRGEKRQRERGGGERADMCWEFGLRNSMIQTFCKNRQNS